MADIKKGSRMLVFDHLLYENDRSTPLSVTMKPAAVVRIYTKRDGRKVVDVIFDHRPTKVSCGHFANVNERIEVSDE